MDIKISQPFVIPNDEEFIEICCYRNGNRSHCTTFSKIRYFFNKDRNIN